MTPALAGGLGPVRVHFVRVWAGPRHDPFDALRSAAPSGPAPASPALPWPLSPGGTVAWNFYWFSIGRGGRISNLRPSAPKARCATGLRYAPTDGRSYFAQARQRASAAVEVGEAADHPRRCRLSAPVPAMTSSTARTGPFEGIVRVDSRLVFSATRRIRPSPRIEVMRAVSVFTASRGRLLARAEIGQHAVDLPADFLAEHQALFPLGVVARRFRPEDACAPPVLVADLTVCCPRPAGRGGHDRKPTKTAWCVAGAHRIAFTRIAVGRRRGKSVHRGRSVRGGPSPRGAPRRPSSPRPGSERTPRRIAGRGSAGRSGAASPYGRDVQRTSPG